MWTKGLPPQRSSSHCSLPTVSSDYLRVAEELRRQGLSVELYPDARKLGAQMKYADRRGHRLAVIIGDTEWETGSAQVKVLDSGESVEVPLVDLGNNCRRLLGATRG